jgi:hypothetical protein
VLHRPVIAATHQKRRAPISSALARLIKEDGPMLGRNDSAAHPVRRAFGDHHLTLTGMNFFEFRKDLAREGVCGDDDSARPDRTFLSFHEVCVRTG